MQGTDQSQNYQGTVSDSLRMPLVQQDTSDVIRLQISNEEMLEEFSAKLRGKVRDRQTGEWIGPYILRERKEGEEIITERVQIGIPRLSEFGVTRVMAVLDILGNKASFMGPTDKDGREMQSMHFSIVKEIVAFFMCHYKDCEFRSMSDMGLLTAEISNFVWQCLTRTREGGERAGFRQTTQTHQSFISSPQQKQGWFERLRKVKY